VLRRSECVDVSHRRLGNARVSQHCIRAGRHLAAFTLATPPPFKFHPHPTPPHPTSPPPPRPPQQVETNRISSFVFTVFVGILGVPSIVTHCVFGCCMLVDLQQLLYANRMAMSNVRHGGPEPLLRGHSFVVPGTGSRQ
jgi:hypothetical protein